jgi:hypothetical protein
MLKLVGKASEIRRDEKIMKNEKTEFNLEDLNQKILYRTKF